MTGAALRMTRWHFCGKRNSLDSWSRKIETTLWYEAVSSALNFPFLKDVSPNCFVFDGVNLKNEEVSQNCFVFDVVKCKN